MAFSTTSADVKGTNAHATTARGAFGVMSSLFFLWGFMTVFNDILIPRFKVAFALTYLEAMLVQSAFFGAYFVGALGYFLVSIFWGDPIAKIGYKNGVVGGLLLSAAGSLGFWPAANASSYPMFLAALFVVGLGFALLQIAANPYVTVLGPERTAASRLNLAQGFNSVGTTVGPLIGGWLIFHYFADSEAHGAESVKVPYLVFSLVFIAIAAGFFFLRLPSLGAGRIERGAGALKHPHVVFGVVAIFMYVGAEVTVGSAIINFLGQPDIAGLSELEASKFVSLYWGGLLIGRFMGAVQLSELPAGKKNRLLAIIPLLALVFLWLAQSAPLQALQNESPAGFFTEWSTRLGSDAVLLANYVPFLLVAWALFRWGGASASRTLAVFAATVVLLLSSAMLLGGKGAMWCIVAVGLFVAVGWSNVFALAIDGIGVHKSQASSLLVMAILGGAVLPPLQGYVADASGSLRLSFVVPLLAYAYVWFYGWRGHRVGR